MANKLNLLGQKFGKLKVVASLESLKGQSRWECVCDCGNTSIVTGWHLKGGHTKSCGCLQREVLISSNTKHGLSKHRLMRIWTSMMTRCYNPNSIGYKKHYGSKGIKVCERWHTFINFYEDVIDTYKDGLTIDRFPNKKGNYEPGNFRWITPKEQTRNVSCNIIIEYDGKKMCVGELCEITGLPYTYLYGRIVTRGWSVKKALETPSRFSVGRGSHPAIKYKK